MKRKYLLLLLPLIIVITGCPLFNKLPIWTAIPDLVKNIGDSVNINLLTYCTDPDGDPLTFTVVSGPGTIVASNYTWTVTGPVGPTVITIRASDGKGETNTSFTITVKGSPNVPSDPSPANNATGQNYPSVTLSWTGGDPDGDTVTYDLYFGTAPNPPLYQTGLSYTTYGKGLLQSYTRYYWKIVAKDGTNTVTGPIWSFVTKPNETVNDNFESRPIGTLSADTLPWATYSFDGTSYSSITATLGFQGSRGLTFVDPTVAGFSRISRNISALKKGYIEFYLRVSNNAHFGFRNNTIWAPYILTGDMGDGFGLYSYNASTGVFTKIHNISSNTWYKIFIFFDFNAGQNLFQVYVDNELKKTENLTGSFSMTNFAFLTFTDKICGWADLDNVMIVALEPNYTTSEMANQEIEDSSSLSHVK
jgi:hypothetical protein